MFEIRPEFIDLLRIYKEFIDKPSNINETNAILFSAFSIIAIIYLGITIFKANKNKKCKIKIEPLIVLFIGALFLAMSFQSQIDIESANQAISYYNSQHNKQDHIENSKENIEIITRLYKHKDLSETNPVATKFEKSKNPFDLFGLVIDKVHYTQLKVAPEGDAPVVKTRIVTKSDVEKRKEYQNILPTEDVQLIKIETIDNQTMVTAHIKVKGQSYKVEVSDLVLDKMLQSKTAFYYDEETKQLVVGV